MKRYQIKVYEINGDYKATISPKFVISDISFGKNINGGLTDLDIELDKEFGNTEFVNSDVVRVTAFDDENVNGILLYTGVVSGVLRTQDTNKQTITLVCLGATSLLNQVIYDNVGKVFEKDDEPANIIKEIIDYINTKYLGGWFTYSGGNIENYGSNVNIDFDYTDCFKSIQKVKEKTGFYFYIDQLGEVYFKENPTTSTHNLTNQKDVELVTINEETEELVNKLYLKRKDGTVKVYEDVTSQTTYGIKEKYLSKTDIVNEATQDDFGNNYIAENKAFKKESKVVVNSKYNLEALRPGDTIKIRNISYEIENVQILKVSYTPDKVQLTLDKLLSFGEQVNFIE